SFWGAVLHWNDHNRFESSAMAADSSARGCGYGFEAIRDIRRRCRELTAGCPRQLAFHRDGVRATGVWDGRRISERRGHHGSRQMVPREGTEFRIWCEPDDLP